MLLRLTAALCLVQLATMFGLGEKSLHAQYPPPQGSVTLTTDSVAPPVGSRTTLTCVVRDTAGQPIANAPCTYTIVNEPGGPNGDAAVGSKTITRYTDANGVATNSLYVGTTPGVISVSVTSNGISSLVLVTVTGSAPLPPAAPIETGSIRPPQTGDAGLRN